MKRRFGGILTLVALALLIGGGWTGWQAWQIRQARRALLEVARSPIIDALIHGKKTTDTQENKADASAEASAEPFDQTSAEAPEAAGTVGSGQTPPSGTTPTPEEQIDLALRGIKLSQGEGGVETWRLRADWATLQQESGRVQARDPHIRYAMGEPERTVDGKPFFAEDQYVNATSRTGRVEDNNNRLTMETDVRVEYQDEVLTGPIAVFYNADRLLVFPQGAELAGPRLAGKAGVLRWNLSTNILEGENRVEVIWTPTPETTSNGEAPDEAVSGQAASGPDKQNERISLP